MLIVFVVRYQVIYQIGVFISRSSVSLIQIPQVFVFPIFQVHLCHFLPSFRVVLAIFVHLSFYMVTGTYNYLIVLTCELVV